ncbi:phosphoenolpyruvate synthase [Chitinophaga cymbidii]|uniref:Phosphoenolpyruvate synthase n=1 Tax=Chitinophaga cymbidii TaxID=1096750 RepID=A0A512RPL0_9BACT|nr:phosphoenolpyruvate synthase [Chitinophaga cymbidii]GEP97627.1 phosphoenolpyruvate synthase [Chitinophaga cymbidii]
MNKHYIMPLEKVGIGDISLVGGKNASLGEMLQHLTKIGIKIPDGFVITTHAYDEFIRHNDLIARIQALVKEIDYNQVESLRRAGLSVRNLVRNARFPTHLSQQIIDAYTALSARYGQDITDVAVRSSATAEDLPDASFAGQQETYLNVRGPAALVDAVRNCFASLFTDRAISYRQNFGYDHFTVGLSVCVQKMVRSDLGASGVAFSLDTESGFRDVVVINGSYGLGEMIVQGAVSPDEYVVFKPALKKGHAALIEKKLGAKDKMMVYGDDADERVRVIPTERAFQHRFCLKDSMVLQLAGWVMKIEDYYCSIKGTWTPMDVEWAIDGISKELFIVQARPETVHSRKNNNKFIDYRISDESRGDKVLVKGIAVGDKIVSGRVNILYSLDKRVLEGNEFNEGDVLVTDMTDPDWEPIMKKASAIVTNKGGRTCHAAIVAREMGLPAIVGCGNATEPLRDGQTITVSCAEGDAGYVYDGAIRFVREEYDLDSLPAISTDLLLNVASPSMSFQFAHLPNKGVGLAREEFIINNYIQMHPLALLQHEQIKDAELSEQIKASIAGYENEEDFFVNRLACGVAKIAASFYPNKVIVRFSDFKSNEYYNLLGGKYFEPKEENPMIGWRGASRYYSDAYKPAFGLECKAIRKAREEMGLHNIVMMIPFCRTVEELLKVRHTMEEFGLIRGENGLELYLMAELPSNIILADEFAKHIDGFSIGSNDLTQLTLGLDRDSSLVAHLYDERNPAVKEMIRMLIRTAKKNGVKVGICGQGPSDYPDFARFLVEEGIDSISVTPDSIFKTIHAIAAIEKELREKKQIVSAI